MLTESVQRLKKKVSQTSGEKLTSERSKAKAFTEPDALVLNRELVRHSKHYAEQNNKAFCVGVRKMSKD